MHVWWQSTVHTIPTPYVGVCTKYRAGQEDAAKKWLDEVWLYYPTSIAGNVNAMQKSLWYTDLIPLAKQRCLQYQQKVKITCP